MQKYLKNLILVLGTISLVGCASGGTNLTVGKEVTVSSCRHVWTLIREDQKQLPLGDFEGCDIFTKETLRDINHNKIHVKDYRKLLLMGQNAQ